MPLYHRQDNGDGRCPVREIGTLSAGVNRYSTVVRSTETSTQNTNVKKKNVFKKVHAKIREIFAVLILWFLFLCFGRGSRKSRKFGPHENFPLYSIWNDRWWKRISKHSSAQSTEAIWKDWLCMFCKLLHLIRNEMFSSRGMSAQSAIYTLSKDMAYTFTNTLDYCSFILHFCI